MSAIAAVEEPVEAAPKKKGGKLKKLILFVVLPLILIGGGTAAGLHFGRGAAPHAKEDPDRPKLVVREGHTAPDGPDPAHPDPRIYKATYYPIETIFTSNLRNTDGFAQVGIGVSTYYDGKVIDHLKNDEMPIRSAVLLVLANQDPDVMGTTEGKARLQKELRDAINKVLVAKEGFGGIDDVYFTSLVVQ